MSENEDLSQTEADSDLPVENEPDTEAHRFVGYDKQPAAQDDGDDTEGHRFVGY